jgi:formylglycine-generating enzyme required for sulfatase activity
VSRAEAELFCDKLRKREQLDYRLPSEAEWEYAARTGTKSPFWQGETITTNEVNFDGNYPYRKRESKGAYRNKPTPVRELPPNPWGLHDMGGNLKQWCVERPGATSQLYVLRGGSWDVSAANCRLARRYIQAHVTGSIEFGLRVVVDGRSPSRRSK